jgi:hypothetical protein
MIQAGSEIGTYGFTDSGKTSNCYKDQLQTVYGCFGQSFLYRHGIQLFSFFVFNFELYADLPIALTIVHTHLIPPQYQGDRGISSR